MTNTDVPPEPKSISRDQRLALIGIFLATFLAAIDQTIVSTALPRITQELSGTERYAWVATAYLLAAVVAGPVFGRLAEITNVKRVYLCAAILFLFGSALCGLAPTMETLIGFRAIQGLGGGALFAVALTVIGLVFPPRIRGRVQGVFGAVWALSSVCGPWLGGLLTDHFSWRWVFYINMPIGAVALGFLARNMPSLEPARGPLLPGPRTPSASGHVKFDFLGAIFLASWTVPLMLGLSLGGTIYPWLSFQVLGCFGLATLGLVAFVVAESRINEPLFDLGLFKIREFSWSCLAMLFFGGAFMGVMLFLPLYLVAVKDLSATNAGLTITPLTLGIVVGSIFSGRYASRTSKPKPLLVGSCLWLSAAIFVVHLVLETDTPTALVLAMMVLIGLGLGPGMALFPLIVQAAVPRSRIGTATSASLLFRQLGMTVSAALLGTVMVSTLRVEFPAHLSPEFRQQGALTYDLAEMRDPAKLKMIVRNRFENMYDRIGRAMAGDEVARLELLIDPIVSEERKATIPPGGLPPGIRDRILPRIHENLRNKATLVVGQLKEGLKAGITAAVRQVYLFAALMALACVYFAMLLPQAGDQPGDTSGEPWEAVAEPGPVPVELIAKPDPSGDPV